MKRTSRADFEYRFGGKNKKVLMIVDLDLGKMSVTNDIENVVADIAAAESIDPKDYLILYRDSDEDWGRWDATTEDFFSIQPEHLQLFFDAPGPVKTIQS